MADTRRVNRLLKWLDKQRLSHLDMVTDAGDSSMWCKEEAELIRDHMKTVETMRREIEELARLREALTKINVGDGWAAQIARAALSSTGEKG